MAIIPRNSMGAPIGLLKSRFSHPSQVKTVEVSTLTAPGLQIAEVKARAHDDEGQLDEAAKVVLDTAVPLLVSAFIQNFYIGCFEQV